MCEELKITNIVSLSLVTFYSNPMFKYFAIISITLVLMTSCSEKTTEGTTENKTINAPEQVVEGQEQQAVSVEPTEPAYANVTFMTLDSKEVNVSDYKGKRVLVNLWATWCGPCVREMPSLNSAYNQLKDDNYVFLVASNEPIEKIKGFENATNYDFTIVKADDRFEPFDIRAIPTTIVFDTKGEVAMTVTGGREWDAAEMLEVLRNVE